MVLVESVGSGIQTEHRGGGLCLLHDIWGPSWEDMVAGSWDHLAASFTCLVVDVGCQLGLQLGP